MISIITPAYNPNYDKFLKLIQSIRLQTNKEYEWIIVDDGSEKFVDSEFNTLLENINYHLVRNEGNMGVGETRNRAIKISSGSHLVFVDCDDYISEQFVEEIMRKINEVDPDILFFDYIRESGGRQYKCNTLTNLNAGWIKRDDAVVASTTNVCGKVVRKKIIDEYCILFPSIKRYEDWVFMTRALYHSSSIYYLKESLYYYVNNQDSAVHNSRRNGYEFAFMAYKMIKDFTSFQNDIEEILYIREVIYLALKEKGKEKKEHLVGVVSRYEKEFPEWKQNSYIKSLEITKRIVLNLYMRKLFLCLKALLYFC